MCRGPAGSTIKTLHPHTGLTTECSCFRHDASRKPLQRPPPPPPLLLPLRPPPLLLPWPPPPLLPPPSPPALFHELPQSPAAHGAAWAARAVASNRARHTALPAARPCDWNYQRAAFLSPSSVQCSAHESAAGLQRTPPTPVNLMTQLRWRGHPWLRGKGWCKKTSPVLSAPRAAGRRSAAMKSMEQLPPPRPPHI